MSRLSRSLAGIALLTSACGGSQYPALDDPLPAPGELRQSDARAAKAAKAPSAPGTLQRADVVRVVDAGLGRFLAHVNVEPSLSAGKFTGWTIVGLQPPDLWQGVDLAPGDVVTRVNGMPIERETEAYDAFQAVRQAPVLEVSYLRRNQPRMLRFTILGAPSPALPQAPPASPGTPPG